MLDYTEHGYDLQYTDDAQRHLEVRKRVVLDLRAGRLVIPPFPRVAAELHKIAQSVEPDLAHACRLIQREVELAGRVVKAACSPVFGGRPVTSLEGAAARLGANGLRDVAMMTAMSKVLRAGKHVDDALAITRHSFVVAVLSRWLCEWLGLDKAQGFLCGLFHDVGRLLLAIALAEYGAREPHFRAPEFVRSTSDLLHAEVGTLVLSSWGLHNTVKEVVEHHHQPSKAPTAGALARVVQLADLTDRLPAADLAERRVALGRHPAVLEASLTPDLIEELAAGVERVRADDVLNCFVG